MQHLGYDLSSAGCGAHADQEQGRPPKKKKKMKDADMAEFEAEIAAIEDVQADEVFLAYPQPCIFCDTWPGAGTW